MGSPEKPNIIFITFDSGRADHMGFMGYKKNITPFLDSLAKRGAYFKRAYATGPGSSVSFVGIFTSTYPLDYGGYSYVDKPRVLLSEAMRDAGYRTIGVHSSPYLSSYFGYGRGWDEFLYANYFLSARGMPGGEKAGAAAPPMSPGLRRDTAKAKMLKRSANAKRWLKKYLPPLALIFGAAEKSLLLLRKIAKDIFNFRPAFYVAAEINEEIKRLLPKKPDKPLFLWLHYLDAHGPYALFARKSGNFWLKVKYYLGDVLAFLFADTPLVNRLVMPLLSHLYDESLRYVDKNIKELLAHLESIGIDRENSVFVICADHGEAFLEHGNFGHSQMLFNVNINVPLVFYGPRYLHKSGAVLRPASLIDVSPTILDLAGIRRPDSYKGTNLFDEKERDVVAQASESEGDLSGAAFTGITIIHGGYKLVHWKDKRCLFSLDDQKEDNNLYEAAKDVAQRLEARLEQYKPVGREMQK